MKRTRLFRVRTGSSGQLPKGYPEGMLMALTESEVQTLAKNTLLNECFEPVELISHNNEGEVRNGNANDGTGTEETADISPGKPPVEGKAQGN